MKEETSIPFQWRSPFDLHHPVGGAPSGIVAGLSAEVITGIAARFVMVIITLALGNSPIFTINGTLTIIKESIAYGVFGGSIFGFFQPFFLGSIVKKGLKYGVILSVIAFPIFYLLIHDAFQGPILPTLPPLVYGFVLGQVIIQLIPKN